jgi:hypothetical protein
MNSNAYSLYYLNSTPGSNTYYNIFTYEGEGRKNKENIGEADGENKENNISSHYTSAIMQGSACPTRALADGVPLHRRTADRQIAVITSLRETR